MELAPATGSVSGGIGRVDRRPDSYIECAYIKDFL